VETELVGGISGRRRDRELLNVVRDIVAQAIVAGIAVGPAGSSVELAFEECEDVTHEGSNLPRSGR
jgi:hypothetical protein